MYPRAVQNGTISGVEWFYQKGACTQLLCSLFSSVIHTLTETIIRSDLTGTDTNRLLSPLQFRFVWRKPVGSNIG